MKKTIVNTFWHGECLTSVEELCIQSFLRHDHVVRMFTYLETRVPKGVVLENAADIIPFEKFFLFENSPSGFSNIFRYKLLLEQGGWWVDTDVFCQAEHLPDCDYYWADESPGQINGAILKFPANDAMCWKLFRLSEERSKNLTRWGQLGPALLKKVLSTYTPPRLAGSTADAYPLHNLETHFLWLPEFYREVEERVAHSTFIHMWHSMFARMGMHARKKPERGSFLNKLYDDYGITTQNCEDLDVRRSISSYLNQESIHRYWVKEVGREFTALLPLQRDQAAEVAELRREIERVMVWKAGTEDEIKKLSESKELLLQELSTLRSKIGSVRWLARILQKELIARVYTAGRLRKPPRFRG